jgi:penicillin-binding protein 2
MKFDDNSQNLGARITVIQVIAFVLLSVLGVRLYYLQIVKGDSYAERAEEQRIRRLPIPAPRGAILDRNGKILVDSRPTYNIIVSRDVLKSYTDTAAIVAPLVEGLGIDGEHLQERLDAAKPLQQIESINVKENASVSDIAWVEAHSLEFPELRVELQPQRNYPLGKTLAHVLGYVGEVSKKQLEDPKFQERGIKSGDIIGKDGLEATYDRFLRGVDGFREVIVDSRSRIKAEIRTVPPQPGQDLITTIDLDLQLAAEESLANSVTKRGVILVSDPNNGEMLALASAPSYDPNVFSQSNTKEGHKLINALYNDPQKPLLNRAIRGRYYPGSTWKIPESVAALQQGVITIQDSHMVCGGGIQIGNKFTRCMGNHGSPPLDYAITKSCDGYYYRLALKMKPEGLIKMVEEFQYDRPTGIDLPAELTSRTPKYWKPIKEKNGRWGDIDTVYSSIGQVYVEVTPISMLRAVASVGVGGKMYVPHFFKEARAVESIGDPETNEFQPERPAVFYNAPEPAIISMTPAQEQLVLKGMWGVVNNGGTAASIKIPDFEIAGKTGTAQNSSLGSGGAKDHAWFISFAPAYQPEIAVLGLIENSGFGAANAGPAVKNVYLAYLQKKADGNSSIASR